MTDLCEYGTYKSNNTRLRRTVSHCDDLHKIRTKRAGIRRQSRVAVCSQGKSPADVRKTRIALRSLDLCLYELSNEADVLPTCLESRDNPGRLNFSVAYDSENMCLTVCVLDAKLSTETMVEEGVASPHPKWCSAMKMRKKLQDIQGPDSCVVVRICEKDGSVVDKSTRICKNTLQPFYA